LRKKWPVPARQAWAELFFKPVVDIFENDSEITLLADMPGVSPDSVNIDLRNGVLTIAGDIKPWEGPDESDVRVEFEIGKYYRQFTLSETIDQEKIEANLEDGTLRLTLPKSQKAIPRPIVINTN
jgi:HSP20 family molecular chaperone IbpA